MNAGGAAESSPVVSPGYEHTPQASPSGAAETGSPKRGLLLTFVLVAALGIAGGVGFLQSQINPTFGDVRELEAATGLTAFGSIGIVRLEAAQRAHRLEYIAYIALFALILVTYVGLCAWMADDFKTLLR